MSLREGKRIFLVEKLCIGCGACAKVCALVHGGTALMHFDRKPYLCAQCPNPACADVCSSEAFFVAPNGLMSINPLLCVGCRKCAIVCPFSAVAQTNCHIATKCDLCATLPEDASRESELPCVALCPTGALIFATPSDVVLAPKFGATLFERPKLSQSPN